MNQVMDSELREAIEMLIRRFEREYQDLTDGQYGSIETFPEVRAVRRLIKRAEVRGK